MKKEKIKKIILISIGILLILLIGLFIGSKIIFKNKEKSENIQNEKNLINDYYTYVNEDILETNEISDNNYGWSVTSLLQEEIDKEKENIIKELLNNENYSDMKMLYDNFLDLESRNETGIKQLQKYIDLIDNAKNIDEFINNATIVENELYINIFTNYSIRPDFKNTSKNIVYFEPIFLGLGESHKLYTDEENEGFHEIFKKYEVEILKLYGYNDKKAKKVVNYLNRFYKTIALKSKPTDEYLDYDNHYNLMTKNELQKLYSNLNINDYLKAMKIDDQEYFSVMDPDNYAAINAYLTDNNLPLLKEYVKINILSKYRNYLSTDYYEIDTELNNKLYKLQSKVNYEQDVIYLLENKFEKNIDTIYLERHFSEEDKIFMTTIVNDILKEYKKNMNKLEWLSSDTKQKAITKLENIKINIGGTYSQPITYNLKSFDEGSSLLENVLIINKYNKDYELSRLRNNEVQEYLSSTLINAYYKSLDNSINLPAALLEISESNDDYYETLGNIGSIIAHEITHAFDNNGANFDEKGNRMDWWQEEDYNNFKELQEKVSEYYSKYEVLKGIYVDGDLTLGENIADLGAVNCIVQVAKTKNATQEDLKILFESYASLYASEYTKRYIKSNISTSVHAPDKVRVNAVLSSIDEFYEVYDIKEEDLMYVEKSKRVKVW